jgi:hypothetical protein
MPRFGRISNIRKQNKEKHEPYKHPLSSIASTETHSKWVSKHNKNPRGDPSFYTTATHDTAFLLWILRHAFPKPIALKIFFAQGLQEWIFGHFETIAPTAITFRLLSCYTWGKCGQRDFRCKHCRYKNVFLTIQN